MRNPRQSASPVDSDSFLVVKISKRSTIKPSAVARELNSFSTELPTSRPWMHPLPISNSNSQEFPWFTFLR